MTLKQRDRCHVFSSLFKQTNRQTSDKISWLVIFGKLRQKNTTNIFFVSWVPDDHGLQDEKEWHWNNETDVMCFPHDNHLFGHFPLLLLLLLLYLFTAMAAHCTVYNLINIYFSEIKFSEKLRTKFSSRLLNSGVINPCFSQLPLSDYDFIFLKKLK